MDLPPSECENHRRKLYSKLVSNNAASVTYDTDRTAAADWPEKHTPRLTEYFLGLTLPLRVARPSVRSVH